MRITVAALATVTDVPLDATVEHVGVRSSDGMGGGFVVLASLSPQLDSSVAAALRAGFAVRADVITDRVSVLQMLRIWLARRRERAP